ncbi:MULTISPECIES: hypothetical protein [Yersinia]|uniref:hypothetical protein n=1 Tax=Yersinia TaxID=629 RepID=UPI000709744A|nr:MULTISPECIES: hypothetical protein [Yersinia]MDN0126894.1 hypothetical protein [Yersinia massiliensis]
MDMQTIHLTVWVFLYAMVAGYILACIDQCEDAKPNIKHILISVFWFLTLSAILSSYIAMKVMGGHDND